MIDAEKAATLFEDVAFDPARLPEVLEGAGHALGFQHFFLFKMEAGRPDFLAAAEPRERIQAYVEAGWWEVDHRTEYNRRKMKPGVLVRDHLTVPERVRVTSAIYNELYIPGGWDWNSIWQLEIAGERWAFSGMRSGKTGPVTDEEAVQLAQFMPIANRAAMMAIRLRDATIAGQVAGLESAGLSAIVLNHLGKVCFITAKAEACLGPDFGIHQGQLWASDAESQKGVSALAQHARGLKSGTIAPDCIIKRTHGRRPMLIQPIAATGGALDSLPGARLILVLNDLNRDKDPDKQSLCALFGLTPRQAEVAVRLARGESVEEIAERLSLTVLTARDHVKSILGKTDCRRQSQLALLLGRLPRG